MCLYNNSSLTVHCHRTINAECYTTLTQRWPGISGADPTLNQRLSNDPLRRSARVVYSYFRNWYYVRVKWATCDKLSYSAVKAKTLSVTKRWQFFFSYY